MLEIITEFKMPLLIEDLGYLFPKENSTRKRRYGLYQCFCGNKFKTQLDCIKNGNTKSCGCYQKTSVRARFTTHGLKKHPMYNVWKAMEQRTNNPLHPDFKYYGEIGITICDRWKSVGNFIEDMYPTFKEGLSIDRKDNNLGYSKDNCRWVTQMIQSRNTRKIRLNNTSGYRGVTYNLKSKKWISQIGINGNIKYLGRFNTALDAAKTYDTFVIDNNLEHTINGVL